MTGQEAGSERMGTIRGICISTEKGTAKRPVPAAELVENWGLRGDAHAGRWHRQVSLLGLAQIEDFRARGADVSFGAFGENLVVEGFHPRTLPVGARLQIGEALLEVTQIGKECHSHCGIYRTMGDCIMPREGIFTRVLRGGPVRVGDTIELLAESPAPAREAAAVK